MTPRHRTSTYSLGWQIHERTEERARLDTRHHDIGRRLMWTAQWELRLTWTASRPPYRRQWSAGCCGWRAAGAPRCWSGRTTAGSPRPGAARPSAKSRSTWASDGRATTRQPSTSLNHAALNISFWRSGYNTPTKHVIKPRRAPHERLTVGLQHPNTSSESWQQPSQKHTAATTSAHRNCERKTQPTIEKHSQELKTNAQPIVQTGRVNNLCFTTNSAYR